MAKDAKILGYRMIVVYMDEEREEYVSLADPHIHTSGMYAIFDEKDTGKTIIVPLANVRVIAVTEVLE